MTAQMWAVDPKRMELSYGRPLFARYADTAEAAVEHMHQRANRHAGKQRTRTPPPMIRFLELGFGRGNAVAATGADVSPVQCERAPGRWGHLPNADFTCSDVVDFLSGANGPRWEAIYSIWGRCGSPTPSS